MSWNYLLVQFADTSMNVVSERWLLSDNKCAWPPYHEDKHLIKTAKKHEKPMDDWEVYEVRVMYKHG